MAVMLAIGTALSLSGCKRESPGPKPPAKRQGVAWFEEVAASSGLTFEHQRYHQTQHFYFPEITSGGVLLLDYDNDGYLDVYCLQGGDIDLPREKNLGNQLYRNRGDGTFEDVTKVAGVGDRGYGMGGACGDYDGDGDVDLYVTNVGANVLYRNNSDGTFTDVTTAAAVGHEGWGTSAGFVDYDGDGDLDIFIANYINWSPDREISCRSGSNQRDYCQPNNYRAPAADVLYRNNGDGSFTDVSYASGIGGAVGNGLGVAFGDLNGDGRTDIYVANDGDPNHLWLSSEKGRFVNDALMMGCALSGTGVAEAGMGVATIDIDHDGDLDLFMSHLRNESNTLYINEGGFFDDTTATMGLDASSRAYTGFGLGFADFDHDADLDLFVANGRVVLEEPILSAKRPYAEPNLLFERHQDGTFREVLPRGGTKQELLETSRAAAFGDLDNDGDIDIVVINEGSHIHLLRNTIAASDRWLMLRVMNKNNTYAIGATVKLVAAGKTQYRTVQPAYSYCASNDPRVHFGLGEATQADQVSIRWPNGTWETFGPLAGGRVHTLREGD